MRPLVVMPLKAARGTAERIAAAVGGDVAGPDDFAEHVRRAFADGRPLVGVCAAGVLVRILAPLIADKRDEPPVLAASIDGASVVPLLGGHRGANALARRIADALGTHAAVTTAGDVRFGVALDDPPPGWTLANPEHAKAVMAALLDGASARIEGDLPWIEASDVPLDPGGEVTLVGTDEARAGDARTLVYRPRRLVLGVGCERGVEAAEMIAHCEASLGGAGVSPHAVACLASIDLKADEEAILSAARHFGVPARFFSAGVLERERDRLATPSEAVFREVGCHGVAEGAALAAAGPHGELLLEKRKSARTTCAIARAPAPVDAQRVGRARGRLAIVGTGPGAPDWRTPQAERLISTADTLVGYSLYLDLVARLAPEAERRDYPLGEERERCAEALRLAGEGRTVALVSSGDPGIYAMASLVFEVLEMDGLPDGARRADIVVAPGISAMQAASARAGAMLGHDFCAVSLSDLLTPWEAIERRLEAAAEGDFVLALYNPVSKRRRSQLARAREILLTRRPRGTPVIVARSLGREGETVERTTLEALDPESVDMLCTVLVGASTTRAAGPWTYTPRGYDRKERA